MKTRLLLFPLLFLMVMAKAQDNIGIKFFGLSIHPKGDKNAFLMPRKLDSKSILVVNLGAVLSYEKFIYSDKLSTKVVQALYSDCAARTGGFSHIGLRAILFKTRKHSLYGGMGPTLIFRRNWLELEGYQNPDYFKGDVNNKWQYKFLWYGGELEYAYMVTDKIDITTTFIPGYPKLMSLSIGIKYKTNKKVRS